MELTCPKCQGVMRTYERNGVTVDQCTDCRGLFLDRGELERLSEAETRWHVEAPPLPRSEHDERSEHHERWEHPRFGDHHKKRRKRSFLEELFD